MALTRVTSTVLEANAVSAEKLANGSLVTRLYGVKSIDASHFAASANAFSLTTNINLLTANLNQTSANIAAVSLNVASGTGNTVSLLANVNLNAANTIQLQHNLAANVNQTTANVAALETRRTQNIAGAVSTITTADLTASRLLVSSGAGKVAVSTVTATDLSYLDATSSIQTQLNAGVTNAAAVVTEALGIEARRAANVAGAVSTITTSDLTASRAVVSSGTGKVAISDVTSTELGYLDGVTSAVQTQLDAGVTNAAAVVTEAVGIEARRVANIAGAVSTITTSDLTASRAVVSSGAGKVAISDVTSTELGYLDGVTSAVQTQLDSKIAITASAANDFVTFTRLNANINLVSANVALGLKQLINVAASATGEGTGSNNFFVATPPGSNPVAIDNVVVSLNGITQTKTTDYIYTPASGKVTFTDAAIPSGLTVQIITLNPPT